MNFNDNCEWIAEDVIIRVDEKPLPPMGAGSETYIDDSKFEDVPEDYLEEEIAQDKLIHS